MVINARSMISEDRPAILEILQATREFSLTEVKVAVELIDLYLEHGISSDYHILVAATGNTPAGYICFGPTPLTESTWDIYWMAVDPEKKRQGIGSRLLDRAESSIRKTGGRLILIETSSKPDYEKTRKFYESRDYEIIARIPDFYTPGDDKIVFQKRLD